MQKDNKNRNDLIDFMYSSTKDIQDEYSRIQMRATEDPGTAGDQGEENWAELLRDWLSPTYQIVTKGRIIGHKGDTSPQVDVLILHPTYPKKLLNKKHYLAGGVIAAFECKLTLETKHITKALECAAKIRRLLPNRTGTPYKELNSPIVFGLLAHSHRWKKEKSKPQENISNKLLTEDQNIVRHPREMLDVLCVADLGVWTAMKSPYIGPKRFDNPDQDQEIANVINTSAKKLFGPQGRMITSYMNRPCKNHDGEIQYYPIGIMITHLLHKLAWEDTYIRPLAKYFRMSDMTGTGEGEVRIWETSEIYTKQLRDEIVKNRPPTLPWDEWTDFDFI